MEAHHVGVSAGIAPQTLNPDIGVRGRTRRALVHRFPYAVFSILDPDLIAVSAVMHGRRDPRRWQTRRR
jgi:plasmid stabilization system protein ParE